MKISLDDIVTMEPEIKARWVAELRSGSRKQGVGFLQNCKDEFCCLGVLSDLAVDEGVISKSQRNNDLYFFGSMAEAAALPEGVIEWANVYTAGNKYNGEPGATRFGRLPFYTRTGSQAYLDELNDSGMPFHQIADIIDYWY